MARRMDKAAELDRQVREVGAAVLAAAEAVGGPAVFLFCSVGEGHGTSTVATAVAQAIAESGKRTVLAATHFPPGSGDAAAALNEILAAGGKVGFDGSRPARVALPRQFMDLPEAARDPRAWVKGFDLLILDGPPVEEFATRYWTRLAHGVVLIIDGEKTSVRGVAQAGEDVIRHGGVLTGVVLNHYRSRVPSFLARSITQG